MANRIPSTGPTLVRDSQGAGPIEDNPEEFQYRSFLAEVELLCRTLGKATRFEHILSGLGESTVKRYRELRAANDEIRLLQASMQRYRELEQSARRTEERLKLGWSLLLNIPRKMDLERDDPFDTASRLANDFDQTGMIDAKDLDLASFPLWKIIREILDQTMEIDVRELEAHLKAFGVETRRSSIESALATHSDQFRISRRDRERFVSLK